MSSVDDEYENRNESIRFSIETKNGKVTKKEVSYVYLAEQVTTLETSEWYQSQKQ
jgi:DNA-directed RNA polymerase subunit E'/Rpb7